MSEPFLGQVCIVGFNFPPRGYAQCDGQILPINQNQSLYSLLGTTYGGDGRTTFALPDLRGRTPVHFGDGFFHGEKGGEETHCLGVNEMPGHTHVARASSTDGDSLIPAGNILARRLAEPYHDATNLGAMKAGTVAVAGADQSHDNMQPFLAINYLIALQGLFPSRN